MDFSWSEAQRKRYDDTVAFAKAQLGASGGFSRERWKACGAFGLLGLPIPVEFGGQGLDALTCVRTVEAVGKGGEDLGFAFSMFVNVFACNLAIARFGTDAQKKSLLPRLCSGELVGAMSISEPEAGSDAFSMTTRATREGEEYVLSGQKAWVTNGPVADVILVQAVTNPAFGHMGISGFLLEGRPAGLSLSEPVDLPMLKSAPVASMTLKDVRVPRSALVGKEGLGATIFRSTMQWERTCVLATYVGAMERTLERTVEFAKKRVQFKKPIGQNQGVSHLIANMRLRLESARLLLYRACWKIDQAQDAEAEVSMAKIAVGEAAIQTALDAIQVHGGVGCLSSMGLVQFLADGLPSTIFSGTSELHRNIIAARLGL